jgi:hypothetical protein
MPQRILSPEEAKRAEFWNNKWPKDRIIYNAQYGRPRDVRTFIFDRSFILEDVLIDYGIVHEGNDDKTMHKILMSVITYFKYVGDEKTKGQPEFWQNPEDSVTAGTGDCEDGAILIKSLSLVAGIPDYKVKIGAGMVKGGGHAYVIYLRDDDTQCILDWCIVDNARTKVNTPTGSKRFSELNVGDEVLGFNEITGKIEPTKIIKMGNRESDYIFKIRYLKPNGNEGSIFCTGEHPWLVNGVWKRTDVLSTSDEIYWASPHSLANMFQREEQYERTSVRQTENNIFTRPDVRRKLSENNCMKRPRIVEKAYRNRTKNGKKSLPEVKFINFCKDNNLPVKFVGHGDFWVNGKNPDFKVIGEKKIIEVTNYNYLNRNESWAEDVIKHYSKSNFKAKVVFFDKNCKNMMVNSREISDFVLNGVKILSVEHVDEWKNNRKIDKIKTVWNIHCEPHNNYFVNGLLSHNCYWPNDLPITARKNWKQEENYYDLWFSFNRTHSFAAVSTSYGPGGDLNGEKIPKEE